MRLAWLLLLALPSACGAITANDTAGQVTALYDTGSPRADFFALPWPSDERIATGPDGAKHLDLAGFPGAGAIAAEYLALFASEPASGFGTSAAAYFRFSGPIDPATLPADAAASLAPGSSVLLIDVTAGSPTFGRRVPARARFRHEAGAYIGADWLAVLPEPGFPLRERTTYAAVLTDALRGPDGAPVRRDPRFVPRADLAPGVDPARVVVATVYTTAEVTTAMSELREAVYARSPAPAAASLRLVEARDTYDWYEGTYDAPNFQEGDPPYAISGGRIHRGPDGKPLPVRTETLRFALTVPHGDLPASGWPIVLYAHGTGGSYRSFIDDGSAAAAAQVTDARGGIIARLAMISIDQVLHGPRDPTGSNPELTFYNFQNLLSARDTSKQGALDDFSLLRLVESTALAAAPGTGVPIRFDPARIYFKGHSQGGSTGPLFLAFEPKVRAAVLSGAGAVLELALVGKTRPVNVPELIAALLGEDIDEFHPLVNLVQTFLESADPHNYARFFFREPPPGAPPKSIYQSLGIVDHYTPVPTIKALAVAMGVQPSLPALDPVDEPGLAPSAAPPVATNVAGGRATGVLCEYQVPTLANKQAYDGHFVVFEHPDAKRQSNAFLGTHAAGGTAILIP